MAKRSQLHSDSPVSASELVIEEQEHRALADSEEVSIRSLVPVRVVMEAPSGRVYIFERGGVEVKVSLEDVDYLLSKMRGGNPCCGGRQPAKHVFERV